jgi:hypothetical protein
VLHESTISSFREENISEKAQIMELLSCIPFHHLVTVSDD